jgi:CubicO group peptidase (beta-lactamase class C family)
VTSYVQSAVDQGQYVGAVALIARRGRIVQWQAFGHRDVARSNAMRPDSIFQIYSMTKPIASVAALLLMEEGRLLLDDPVSRFIPQFASMQVLEGENAATARLRPAARPISVRHLLTHTAGFAAGEKLKGPAVDRMLEAQLDQSLSLEASAISVSALPLANDPGTRFSYDGVSTEVLSRVVEVAASMPFDDFLRTRLFKPLRMLDTDFSVPRDARNRIVEMASTDAAGRLVTAGAKQNPAGNMLKRYPSGAGGLYSTAGDYARFCQMLLNGGELDGVRILGRKTVELMAQNHLPPNIPSIAANGPAATGYGLGVSVTIDTAALGRPGSVGTFGWGGAATTTFSVNPSEDMAIVIMGQVMPSDGDLLQKVETLVYQALVDAP